MVSQMDSNQILLQAKSRVGDGDLRGAEELFMRLSSVTSLAGEVAYGLGIVRFREGNGVQAGQLFEKALQIGQNRDNSAYFLGEIALQGGSQDRAIAWFGRALSFNPRHAAALQHIINLSSTARLLDEGNGGTADRNTSARTNPSMGDKPPRIPLYRDTVIGIADQVRLAAVPFRGKAAGSQSLTFRVRVHDRSGNVGPVRAIELRGNEIRGAVENGDWVELIDPPRGGAGRVKRVFNLTTNEEVRSKMFILTAR
ncbi:M48 family metallopeptidase [Frankia sp. Cj3]|uniref:tetratricopeptide repeat protein n=1 Tax=Frankia sp. Cj3 TaxID=2880976 RepID=UPI001EF59B0D|nr:tetratricopeptide repeat protein [Frankia sp. Cj3]